MSDDYDDFDFDGAIEADQHDMSGMDAPDDYSDSAAIVKDKAALAVDTPPKVAAALVTDSVGGSSLKIDSTSIDIDEILAEDDLGLPPPLDRPRDETDEKRMRDFVSKLVRRTKPVKGDDDDDVTARWEADIAATRANGGYGALLARPPTDGAPCIEVTLPESGRFYIRTSVVDTDGVVAPA